MNRKLSILITLLMVVSTGWSQNMQALADTADQAYKDGNYSRAATYYDSIVNQGDVSAELYYNLANAYFKQQDLADAILYYEKALQRAPHNDDIKHNLQMARQMTLDKIEKVPEMFYVRWWSTLSDMFSTQMWAYLVVIFFIVTIILTGLFLLSRSVIVRKSAFYSGIVTLLITIFAFVFASRNYNAFTQDKAGIVFKPSVTVKGSPDAESVDLFVIHEGTKVFIQDKLGNWYEVRIANGSVGWIPQETIRGI